MIAEYFPENHHRVGELTNFKENILLRKKKHTIRKNFTLWKHRIDMVKSGDAVLSLRQWSKKPYRSKHKEFLRLYATDNIGVQKIEFFENHFKIDGLTNKAYAEYIPENDGLSKSDFYNWFSPYDLSEPMALIHFTGFRYNLD